MLYQRGINDVFFYFPSAGCCVELFDYLFAGFPSFDIPVVKVCICIKVLQIAEKFILNCHCVRHRIFCLVNRKLSSRDFPKVPTHVRLKVCLFDLVHNRWRAYVLFHLCPQLLANLLVNVHLLQAFLLFTFEWNLQRAQLDWVKPIQFVLESLFQKGHRGALVVFVVGVIVLSRVVVAVAIVLEFI